MAEPSAPVNRFERRRQRNRQALLEAAIELFQERGIRGAKLEDICARADVAPRTFFNHFETREHLYHAIAQQRARQAAALFDASAADPRPIARAPARAVRPASPTISTSGRSTASWSARCCASAPRAAARWCASGRSGAPRSASSRAASRAARSPIDVRPEVLADLLLGALTTALSNWSALQSYPLARELRDARRDALLILFTAAQAIDAPR